MFAEFNNLLLPFDIHLVETVVEHQVRHLLRGCKVESGILIVIEGTFIKMLLEWRVYVAMRDGDEE